LLKAKSFSFLCCFKPSTFSACSTEYGCSYFKRATDCILSISNLHPLHFYFYPSSYLIIHLSNKQCLQIFVLVFLLFRLSSDIPSQREYLSNCTAKRSSSSKCDQALLPHLEWLPHKRHFSLLDLVDTLTLPALELFDPPHHSLKHSPFIEPSNSFKSHSFPKSNKPPQRNSSLF